jgi:HEAT repeat protein
VIPELRYLLNDDSAKSRRIALETLSAFHDPDLVPDIAVLLSDPKDDVQLAAAQALATIGGKEAIEMVKARMDKIKDEDVREEIGELFEEIFDVEL